MYSLPLGKQRHIPPQDHVFAEINSGRSLEAAARPAPEHQGVLSPLHSCPSQFPDGNGIPYPGLTKTGSEV